METTTLRQLLPSNRFNSFNSIPHRNMSCGKYDFCLTRAAYLDKRDLGCLVCNNMDMAAKVDIPVDLPKKAGKEIVNHREAANYLGISRDRLRELEKAGSGPKSISNPSSGSPEYRISELKALLVSGLSGDEVVAAPAAATAMGLSARSLRTLRDNKTGPVHIKNGKYYLYRLADARAYRKAMKP